MLNLTRALDHYGAMYAELQRQEQVERVARLSRVAELDRSIEREQAADTRARER